MDFYNKRDHIKIYSVEEALQNIDSIPFDEEFIVYGFVNIIQPYSFLMVSNKNQVKNIKSPSLLVVFDDNNIKESLVVGSLIAEKGSYNSKYDGCFYTYSIYTDSDDINAFLNTSPH